MSHAADHGALVDSVYRHQRLIYDVTRKYDLLGSDRLVAEMDVQPGQSVLEVACGTGRNLALIGKRHPLARLFGLDISEQMLLSARDKLGGKARLARADACAFDPESLFGEAAFGHVVLSYSLSMIPDWHGALREALMHLSPGGTLHIVDFGDQHGLPRWFRTGLHIWLSKFHVSPRETLPGVLDSLPGTLRIRQRSLCRGYALLAQVSRR